MSIEHMRNNYMYVFPLIWLYNALVAHDKNSRNIEGENDDNDRKFSDGNINNKKHLGNLKSRISVRTRNRFNLLCFVGVK